MHQCIPWYNYNHMMDKETVLTLGQLNVCFEFIHSFRSFWQFLCRYSWVRNKHTRIRHTKHRSAAWGSFFRYHPVVVVYTCNILSYCLSTLTIDQLTSMLLTLFKDVFPTFRFRCLLIIVNRHVPMHVK